MARRVFDPERGIWKPLGALGDLLMLSLLWGTCCIPVLTVGSATTALYDTAVHALRRRDDALLSRFFTTFKRELKSGILSTLLWIAVLALLWLLRRALAAALPEGESRAAVPVITTAVLGFFALCVLAWVFPTLSRFTFGTLGLNVTALRLAFGHILRSAALALLIGSSAWLCLRFGLPIMVLPGLAAWLATFLIEPVFARYEKAPEGGAPAGDGPED